MYPEDLIRSVSGSQYEILWNIMQLHNNGDPFECDITYSKGCFYGKHGVTLYSGEKTTLEIPQPRYKFDVEPQTEDTIRIDPWGRILLDDNSIESIVIDLPFVITVGPSLATESTTNNLISRRFSGYYPASQLYESYFHWIKEAYRVLKPKGICVFKTQATISGGLNHDVPRFSAMCAEKIGFVVDDDFTLVAKSRMISRKVKKQAHARKFHCHFLVFKKLKSKKFDKINYYNMVERLYREPKLF